MIKDMKIGLIKLPRVKVLSRRSVVAVTPSDVKNLDVDG